LLNREIIYALLIVGVSICINLYQFFHKPVPVVQTITKIKYVPKTITKVHTRVETTTKHKVVEVTPTKQVEAYKKIISSPLLIETNPLDIIEDMDGKILISEYVTGNADLADLSWDITINLYPREVYRKPLLPLAIGFILDTRLESDIGLVMDVPFLSFLNIDTMIGLREANLGYRFKFTETTSARTGIFKDYLGEGIGVFIGIRTKIF